MADVYFIAGTPGVGKSTIGAAVAERLGMEFVELLALAGSIGDIDARALSARGGSLAMKSERDLLIATHIAFKPRNVRVKRVVVLRRNPLKIMESIKRREYNERKLLENVEAELLGVVYSDFLSLFGGRRVVQIDVSDLSVEEAIEVVIEAMNSARTSDNVDWIRTLEERGELDGLLKLLASRVS